MIPELVFTISGIRRKLAAKVQGPRSGIRKAASLEAWIDTGFDNCYQFRIQNNMGRWKRFGVIVVRYATDHAPRHVHVFEDGNRLLKFDIESWSVMQVELTSRARRALEALRKEGAFDEESEI